MNKIINGDCLEELKEMEENSVDSIVCDPPYGISFMGKKWDYDVPKVEVWQEVMRVLKPGGHLLSFAGSRTYHRMAVNIEDAGFEIRDQIMWVYGSGFPKSHNIEKTLTKMGEDKKAIEFSGFGTALKPAHEPIVLARKPLSEKTIAKNALKHGTGGINIDGCRVEYQGDADKASAIPQGRITTKGGKYVAGTGEKNTVELDKSEWSDKMSGRFPANFIHDGSDEAIKGMQVKGDDKSRYFYTAKASKKERNKGLEGFEDKEAPASAISKPAEGRENALGEPRANHHPTVKPVKLMQYLCRLITPKGGTILDPFMGSGTTGIAAKLEGFNFIGIELDAEYCKIAKARIEANEPNPQKSLYE